MIVSNIDILDVLYVSILWVKGHKSGHVVPRREVQTVTILAEPKKSDNDFTGFSIVLFFYHFVSFIILGKHNY